MITQQLPPAEKIERLFEERERSLALIDQAIARLDRADDAARNAGFGDLWTKLHYATAEKWVAAHTRDLSPGMWEQLLVACSEHAFIDTMFADNWNYVWRGNKPFDRDTVEQALASLAMQMHKFLPRAVAICAAMFSDGKDLAIPQQGTIQALFDMRWNIRTVNALVMANLDQLHRLMCLADGAPAPKPCDLPSAWLMRKDYASAPWQRYFPVKLFKNGNAKVVNLRCDLVDALNAVFAQWQKANPKAAT